MRATLWIASVGLCLAVGLLPGQSRGQSTLFPIGRPYTFAQGFSGPIRNVPIDPSLSSVVPIPQQHTGITLPNFRSLMLFPNRNIVHGVSPIPPPRAFPGAGFFHILNPFASPLQKK